VKYLLVKPHTSLEVAKRFLEFLHLEPLDLEIVAGGIGPQHDVRILDLSLSRKPPADFAAELRRFQPQVIGFSGYSNQARNVKELAGSAKTVLPQALVVTGGIHATIAPEDYGLPGTIDLVIRGEGATAMRRLTAAFDAGAPLPEDRVFLPVGSAKFGELAALPPPELPPYDQVPRPRRELIDRARYFCVWSGDFGERLPTLFPRMATVRTSVGCPYSCSFCVVHHLANGKYLQREPEDVVDEIAGIPEEHIYFVDDEMYINARRTRRLAELLIERGIRKKYVSWARSDTICRNVELFRLWKQAGLTVLYIGLESMDERTLTDYHKGYTPETNQRAVGILRELGIGLHAALMVNPDFTREDFLRVRKTALALAPAEVSFTVFSPPPGTPLWKQHRGEFICADPHAFYDCMHTLLPTRLPLKTFYRYFALLYLHTFRRNPWRMKKNKAPLRELLRLFTAGARCGWSLWHIWKDYPASVRGRREY